MRRAGFLLFLVLLTARAFGQDAPSWFAQSFLDLREDIGQAAREGKRVMLYVEQTGCPYCKRLVEVNFKQPAIAAKMQRHFVSLDINIWGDRELTSPEGRTMTEKQFAAALKIQYTPTLIFFDEKGRVALRINGYYPPERFAAALDQALSKAGQPSFSPTSRRKPGGKPLAVIVDAPDCAACDELDQVTLKDDAVRAQLAKFDVERLPLSAERARALNVGYVPALVLFDAGGREVLRMEAYFRPFHVAGSLEYVSSGAYRSEPSLQRFLQAKAERMRRGGAAVELWN
jgi:thioredoxin-related protein